MTNTKLTHIFSSTQCDLTQLSEASMKTLTKLVVICGDPGSGKSLLASFLMEHYRDLGIRALLIDDPDIEEGQIQHLSDASLFSYIILTTLPDKKMNAQCLENPFQTITLTE